MFGCMNVSREIGPLDPKAKTVPCTFKKSIIICIGLEQRQNKISLIKLISICNSYITFFKKMIQFRIIR